MTIFMPRELVKEASRTLVDAVAVAQSPFTLSAQTQDWGGRVWQYELEFAIHLGREGREVSAFFAMIGRAGTFLFRDPGLVTQASGSPAVSGAGQTGTALVTSGWPANSTVLRMGDAFSVGSGSMTRLHQLTQDAVSGPTGIATLIFTPALRYAPLNGAALEVRNPAVLLRLLEPVPARFHKRELYRFSLKAMEAL